MESTLGWNGKYATKNGEQKVIGYFVDYYEPNLNVVIEWDDQSHFLLGKLKKKDLLRENNIKKELNCSFYRIKEVDFAEHSFIVDMIKNHGCKKT